MVFLRGLDLKVGCNSAIDAQLHEQRPSFVAMRVMCPHGESKRVGPVRPGEKQQRAVARHPSFARRLRVVTSPEKARDEGRCIDDKARVLA